MKKLFALLLSAASLSAAAVNPLPLTPGKVNVDFSAGSPVEYSFTPAADGVMTFGDMTNVSIYTYNVTPADQCYGESFRSTLYVQVHAGVNYTISVNKGFLTTSSSFSFSNYACPWPDGDSWETAIRPIASMSYVPVTLDRPVYLTYTADSDGVLSMLFNSLVKISGGTDKSALAELKTEYQSGGGGYRAMLDVTAGTTYYFSATSSASFLCSFEMIHPVTGESADFPYVIDREGIIPAAAGTYYYRITNPGDKDYMYLSGSKGFNGSAKVGLSFTSFIAEGTDSIHMRVPISEAYKEYCMVVNRLTDADEDATISVLYPYDPADVFPGKPIEEGKDTTATYPGLYYYSFTVPSDDRKIIRLKPLGNKTFSSETTASLHFGDNQYSTLASGQNIEFDAQAGRSYSVTWNVAPSDAPLAFELEFAAPAAGESASNPIIAALGENSGSNDKSAIYFQYTATCDGWLNITPAEGTPMPAVSMLPIPSDPYTQACEVIKDGNGYRVASTKERGYLIVFFTNKPVSFNLGESDALKGEAPTNPFDATDGVAQVPAKVGTFWFTYTTPRAGKLEITTNLVFTITENRQDYSFVRIYDPADADNQLAQLRPDYDAHTFAPRVMNTEANATYLIKVRTMAATEGVEVKLTVRDPLPGEEPETPIAIDFNGKSGKYTFDRIVNYEEDAVWYSIDLPAGLFTIKGTTGAAFEMEMYAPGNVTTPVAKTDVIDLNYDDENEMYIYTWGISDLAVKQPATYLLKVVDNAEPLTMDITMTATGAISEVNAAMSTRETIYDLQGRRLTRPTRGLIIINGQKTLIK